MFFIDKEAVFSWGRSSVIMGSKLCSRGVEAISLWQTEKRKENHGHAYAPQVPRLVTISTHSFVLPV